MKRGFMLIFFLACFLQVSGQSTGKYQIKFLEVNKKNSDYGVAILDENKLIFTSADHKVTTAKKNYNPRKDLYAGDISYDGEIKNVKRVTKDVNKRVNQTGVTYTKDGRTVYFSRNKYKKKLKKQNLPKNQRLIIYKGDVAADGSWKNVKKVPFNKKKFSTGYPVLSADDSKLYFVSDRLPSKGMSDIFVVDVLSEGNYSQPRNLGSLVNTDRNETTPYITEDNILYFSSDGHEGLGKLDVFAVEVYDNATSEVYKLSSPINSINDDFAYLVNKDNNQGFFTSNRLQGEGFNDLYSFTLEEDVRPGECFITVDGKVRDKNSFEALSGATVDLYSIDGNLIESVATYSDGTYQFTVSCAKEYELVASNPNYLDDKKRIEILEENYHSALHTNLNLSKVEKKQPVAERMSPIYYEYDDAQITVEAAEEMDKIAEIMTQNENLVIQASSYTDSRGTNAYNELLSQRRAKAAVDYLKSKGIDASRIKSKGYGEDKLINQCVNGVECREESHQMNRRTEFNFLNVPGVGNKKSSGSTKTKTAVKLNKSAVAVASKAQKVETPKTEVKVELSEVKPLPQKVVIAEVVPVTLEESKPIESAKTETVKVAATDHQISSPHIQKTKLKIAPTAAVLKKEPEVKTIAKTLEPKKEISKQKEVKVAENSIEKQEVKIEKIEAEPEIAASTKKDDKEQIKEAVVINYNSTIVATNPESNKVLNYIGTEKIKMIDQLTELEKKYADAIPNYPKLSDSLIVQKNKISEIIVNAQEMQETGWSNIIEYKNNVLHFKKKYRALMVSNNRNTDPRSPRRSQGQSGISPNPSSTIAMTEVDNAAPKVVEMEENLSVDNVEITAMKISGSGKYQKTNNASKTELIKVTFKLLSNDKVDSGRKEAHLVLQNLEGKVQGAKGIFTLKNTEKQSKYTDHAIINYNNHDVDVTMFIQRKGGGFEKGVYPIKVFLEGQLMAVTKLDLQKSL